MRNFLIVFVLMCWCNDTNLHAQSKFYRATVGLSTGSTQYNGDINNDFYQFRTINAFTAFNYAHYASPRCDVRFGFAFGSWGYDSEVNNSFNADFTQATIDLKIKLKTADNPRWSPYLFAGMGMNQFGNWTLYNKQDESITTDINGLPILYDDMHRWQGLMTGGAGMQLRLADRVFIYVEERMLFPATDASDGIQEKTRDNMIRHTIGISFGICPWNDSDGDGVEDRDDNCAATPRIAKVDEQGCPIDTDADGIADYEDQCVEIAGVATGHGCPDNDGDSIVDAVDVCPYEPGIAAFGGCPDGDHDGIRDRDDRCPEIAGTAKFGGCADTDGDGVADPDDHCAATPAGIACDAKGCPFDTDHDAIADYLDQCPDVAGVESLRGCPEVKTEVVELFRKALTGIQFETGKDIIRKQSFTLLDSVVLVMQTNVYYKLKIGGHTDNVGDAQKNLDLSDRRAKAVRTYLIEHGVPAERITEAIGYGDQRPVAGNDTREGQARNRRVEFTVEY